MPDTDIARPMSVARLGVRLFVDYDFGATHPKTVRRIVVAGFEFPPTRFFNRAFEEKGRTDVVLIDAFTIHDGEALKLVFESTQSDWRQGVYLKTDRGLTINKLECPAAQLWTDTSPTEVKILCRTSNRALTVFNAWDRGQGMETQRWSSGMLVEELANGRRYRCNDIGFETDFSKLVFRIERL